MDQETVEDVLEPEPAQVFAPHDDVYRAELLKLVANHNDVVLLADDLES